MLREQVLTSWNTLKEQIQAMQWSPSDKTIWALLCQSKLGGFRIELVSDDQLDFWATEAANINNKFRDFSPDNELLFQLNHIALWYSETIADWARMKKTLLDYQDCFIITEKELPNHSATQMITTTWGTPSKLLVQPTHGDWFRTALPRTIDGQTPAPFNIVSTGREFTFVAALTWGPEIEEVE